MSYTITTQKPMEIRFFACSLYYRQCGYIKELDRTSFNHKIQKRSVQRTNPPKNNMKQSNQSAWIIQRKLVKT